MDYTLGGARAHADREGRTRRCTSPAPAKRPAARHPPRRLRRPDGSGRPARDGGRTSAPPFASPSGCRAAHDHAALAGNLSLRPRPEHGRLGAAQGPGAGGDPGAPALRRGAQPGRHPVHHQPALGPRDGHLHLPGAAGVETWEPHFTFHGFRYVEVTGYPGTPALGRDHRLRRRLGHAAGGDLRLLQRAGQPAAAATSSGASAATS